MGYILPPNTFVGLDFLKDKYQKIKQVDLEKEPSSLGKPLFLGGVDVKSRKKQIDFLDKCLLILKPNLFVESEIETEAKREAHITASRTMIAAILFVQSQIEEKYSIRSASNAKLYKLLNEDLHINKYNALNEEDREICFLAAKRLLTSSLSAFSDANIALKAAGKNSFTEKEWANFTDFVCDKTKKSKIDFYQNYPITSIVAPLFGTAFACTGATVGMIVGDSISRSTKLMSTKYQLTAMVGGSLIVFGSAGPGGVALFAPIIAERLVTYFCNITAAAILGSSFGFVGRGVGTMFGMLLDVTYKLLKTLITSMGDYNQLAEKFPIGIRISDGVSMIYGVPVTAVPTSNLPKHCEPKLLEIKDGELYADDKLLPPVSNNALLLHSEMLEELRLKLNISNDEELEFEERLEERGALLPL